MILSTFSRSVWISVYIRAGIVSNGKLTPYFERQLRRLDIFVANDSRMIPMQENVALRVQKKNIPKSHRNLGSR